MAALALLTLTLSTAPSMVVSIAQFPMPVMLPGQGKAPEVPEVRLAAASPEPTFRSAVRHDLLIDETDAPVAEPDTPADGPYDVWAAAFGMKPGHKKPQGAPRPGAPGKVPPRGPAQGAMRRQGARWPKQGAMRLGAQKQTQVQAWKASRPGAPGRVLPRGPAQGAAGRGAPRQGAQMQEQGGMRKASAQDIAPLMAFAPWGSRSGAAAAASQAPKIWRACCEQERQVLAPLAKLTARIEGHQSMNPKNVTQPWALPDVCRRAVMKNDLEHCYYNWGFTREAATCWASERLEMAATCGKQCAPFKVRGKYSLLCENCMADLRKERRLCVFKDMHITESCKTCQLKAFHHWDSNCMMQCVDSVNKRNELAHKPDCAKCNDNVDAMLQQCGAV